MRGVMALSSAIECKRLYVRPNFRNRGIADELLNVLEQDAQSSGVEWIYLENGEEMEQARRLYLR